MDRLCAVCAVRTHAGQDRRDGAVAVDFGGSQQRHVYGWPHPVDFWSLVQFNGTARAKPQVIVPGREEYEIRTEPVRGVSLADWQ